MRPFFLPKEARIVIFMQINYLCSFSHLHKMLLRLMRLEFYFAAERLLQNSVISLEFSGRLFTRVPITYDVYILLEN